MADDETQPAGDSADAGSQYLALGHADADELHNARYEVNKGRMLRMAEYMRCIAAIAC
jgi:hypothetical protein